MPTHPAPLRSWRDLARCRSWPTPDDFHPDPADWQTPGPWSALACCTPCPVAAACLDAGRGQSGTWGGLAEPERVAVYAAGWQLGQPIPPRRVRRRPWVTLAQAAQTLGVPRRRVRGWAERARIDSSWAPMHYGQRTRLVDLNQCRQQLEAA
jgi:hypothetical protein